MKLRKLTIHNIASIEDAAIDFSAKPLADADVFLITGKTGAGKSTVLDAICLALFGETPRLDTTRMQGKLTDSAQAVPVDDPRQLLRRNCGEGEVTLTFTGSNGVDYKAEWAVQRARKRPDGKLQAVRWCWTRAYGSADAVELRKIAEIKAELSEAVGLDFSQFCRTTMLAQGEFTRFLNSNDSEKAAILEKITGVDVYTRIGRRIYEMGAAREAEWSRARERVEGVELLSADDTERINAEIKADEAGAATLAREQEALTARMVWLARKTELEAALTQAGATDATAQSALAADEFKADEQLVARWHATSEARQSVRIIAEARRERGELAEAARKMQDDHAILLGATEALRQSRGRLEASLAELDAYMVSEEPRAATLQQAPALAVHLAAVVDSRRRAEEESARIAADTRTLDSQLRPAAEAAAKNVEALALLAAKAEAALAESERELEAASLPRLRSERDKAVALGGALTRVAQAMTMLNAEQQRRGSRLEALAEMERVVTSLRSRLEADEPALKEAAVRTETCKELLDRQRETVDDWAKRMRSSLSVGDICPVCGQTVAAPLPSEELLASLYQQSEQAWREADRAYSSLLERVNALRADVKARTDACVRAKSELEADTALARTLAATSALLTELDLGTPDADAPARIAARQEAVRTEQARLDALLLQGAELEKRVGESRKALDEARRALEQGRAAAVNAEADAARCEARIGASRSALDTLRRSASEALDALSEAVNPSLWKHDFRSDTELFARELADAAQHYDRAIKHGEELRRSVADMARAIAEAEEASAAILRAMPQWCGSLHGPVQEVPRLSARLSDLRSRVISLTDRLSVLSRTEAAEIAKLQAAGLHSSEAFAELTALDAFKSADILAKQAAANSLRSAATSAAAILSAAREALTAHLAAQPEGVADASPEELEALLSANKAAAAAVSEKIAAARVRLRADADNRLCLSSLIAELERCDAERQRWARLNNLFGSADGAKFRKIAQSYVLAGLIRSANSYMASLAPRYSLSVEPGTFVISIEDSYQGFARRAASTISGGESFLVSLSLALALSDIGDRLSVDTLFIDEGFGTLSGEPLESAIATLRSLHTRSGRHVGIISHVEELRERIPVQLSLSQLHHSSASTITIVAPD